MANLIKFEFIAVNINEKNCLSWTLDAEIHLVAMSLTDTIVEINASLSQEQAKFMIFLRH